MAIQLKLSHVNVSVANKEIVSDLSLVIKPGELHLLMGPNGSGKSSLAQALMGHPNYNLIGNVSLGKQDLIDLTPDERAKAGLFLAFQYPVEIPGVRVKDFLRTAHQQLYAQSENYAYPKAIDFFRYLKKTAAELGIAENLIERGLNDSFSGGEKKQLEVFQMAVLQPKFAILDETDSGLDVDALKKVASIIESVRQQQQVGMIVITHYQRLAALLQPTAVHVLRKGQLVATGSVELLQKIEDDGYRSFTVDGSKK